eukprot:2278060-Prymnesium_polylepis.2
MSNISRPHTAARWHVTRRACPCVPRRHVVQLYTVIAIRTVAGAYIVNRCPWPCVPAVCSVLGRCDVCTSEMSSTYTSLWPAGIRRRDPAPGWLANGHAFGASCPIIISRIEFLMKLLTTPAASTTRNDTQ